MDVLLPAVAVSPPAGVLLPPCRQVLHVLAGHACTMTRSGRGSRAAATTDSSGPDLAAALSTDSGDPLGPDVAGCALPTTRPKEPRRSTHPPRGPHIIQHTRVCNRVQ